MKTENTPENKARFFAQYIQQKCLNDGQGEYLYPLTGSLLHDSVSTDFLSLRSIESLTDEELLHIAEIFDLSPEQIAETDLQEWVEALFNETAGYYIDGYTGTQMQHLVDYLRSIGILIPWMDLSIDDIVAYGWACIKEGE